MRTPLLACAALLALTGAAAAQQGAPQQGTRQQEAQQPARTAAADRSTTVQMRDARGNAVGTVEVRQLAHGTLFVADLRDLPPGAHGFHLHERGACEPPGFQSAGGHYNPTGAEHGFDSPRGPHAGDLPNIHVTREGTAKAEFRSERMSLRRGAAGQAGGAPFPLLDQDGSAIVIHERGDDHRATPPDSTGSRIACGVIGAGQ